MSSIGSFTVDDGVHPYGIHRDVTFEGDQVVTKLTYDAEPFLEQAHAERTATAGERWGDGRKVGTIPMAVYADVMKIRSAEERQKYVINWLKANPAFVTFDKFLK